MPIVELLRMLLQNILPFLAAKKAAKKEHVAEVIQHPAAKLESVVQAPVLTQEAKPAQLVTVEQYLTACNRYPERAKDHAIDDQMLADAAILINRVSSLMAELGVNSIDISSGYRPAAVNANTPNAAKHSGHMSCQAMDIIDDKEQTLWHKLAANPDLLRKYNLFLEDGTSTRGKNSNWCHLDIVQRADRPSRVFKP